MDFCNDNELDYEEDYIEENSQKLIYEKDDINEKSNMSGSDGEYLQIDFSEEEENLVSGERHMKTIAFQNDKKQKEAEKSEGLNKENTSSGREQVTQNKSEKNTSDCSAKTDNAEKNKGSQLQFLLKKKIITAQNAVNQEQNFRHFMNKRFSGKRSFRSMSSHKGCPVTGRRLTQQRNETSLSRFRTTSHNDHSTFRKEDRKIFPRNHTFKNVECKVLSEGENIKETGTGVKISRTVTDQQGLSDDFQIKEGRVGFKQHGFYHQKNNTLASDVNFNEFGVKRCETQNEDDFLKAKYTSLEEDEKKLVKLKKEARLKRFMHGNDTGESKVVSNSDKGSQNDLHVGEQGFQAIEGQKLVNLKSGGINRQPEGNIGTDIGQQILPKQKPRLSKELLLRKRNPFDAKLEVFDCIPVTQVKEENENNDVKEKWTENKLLSSAITRNQLLKKEEGNTLKSPLSTGKGFSVVKTDTDSQVKFVRTISKSFNELGLKSGLSSHSNSFKTFPAVVSGLENRSSPRKGSAQRESHLTGCIVKVLNVPPSITSSDILALCAPVGNVVEAKLNFPKENSVVIRFSESACAEKFFGLYHGRKMRDYFLNVIVV